MYSGLYSRSSNSVQNIPFTHRQRYRNIKFYLYLIYMDVKTYFLSQRENRQRVQELAVRIMFRPRRRKVIGMSRNFHKRGAL